MSSTANPHHRRVDDGAPQDNQAIPGQPVAGTRADPALAALRAQQLLGRARQPLAILPAALGTLGL
jgi:hypothetical protein